MRVSKTEDQKGHDSRSEGEGLQHRGDTLNARGAMTQDRRGHVSIQWSRLKTKEDNPQAHTPDHRGNDACPAGGGRTHDQWGHDSRLKWGVLN